MNANDTLERIRREIREHRRAVSLGWHVVQHNTAANVIKLFRRLDRHMAAGGAPPLDWAAIDPLGDDELDRLARYIFETTDQTIAWDELPARERVAWAKRASAIIVEFLGMRGMSVVKARLADTEPASREVSDASSSDNARSNPHRAATF